MRPSLTEQINGARRVLVDLVEPELDDPYVKEQVAHAAATLERAAGRWTTVLAELVTDIRELEAVLGVARRVLDETVPGVVDHSAAEEYHRELRTRLTDEIRNGPEPSAAVRAYLAGSLERMG
ncbi:hypothetical protein [Candidatus Poriferisocius sp.]|uniref:hypothetical protein n=1 Tax=Candidatus Poriferisocius sp. TaxID=3101276 RepID=UPI003B5BD28B